MVYLQQCFYFPGPFQLSGVFVFPYDLFCCFFFLICVKNFLGIVLGFLLNLQIAFAGMVVFTVSILPFHEREDLCAFFLIASLSCVWTFSLYRFITWYFVAPVNRIVSRAFPSHILVLSIWECYWFGYVGFAAFHLIENSSQLQGFPLGVTVCRITSSASRDTLTPSSPAWILFISFPSFISLADFKNYIE